MNLYEPRRSRSLGFVALLIGLFQTSLVHGAPGMEGSMPLTGVRGTLFQNVRIFDGKRAELSSPSNVLMVGPRIYPSGAFISQTDSPDEVRLRAREQLRLGASQIKLMAGGGVASPYNPIESTQYTEAELRAGVEAADN
jgi:hypothetical protein